MSLLTILGVPTGILIGFPTFVFLVSFLSYLHSAKGDLKQVPIFFPILFTIVSILGLLLLGTSE